MAIARSTFYSRMFSWKYEKDGKATACNVQWLQMFKQMNKWRGNGLMCDFTINAGENSSVHCHKCVLAFHSEYFKIMFTSSLEDSKATTTTLTDYSREVLEDIIDYMYTGVLKISISNAQELLMLADMWQIILIKDACAVFLEKHIDASNCLGLLQLSEQYFQYSNSLSEKCKQLIKQQFSNVIKYEEFLTMKAEFIAEILHWDDINLGSNNEDFVYYAVLKWIGENNADMETSKLLLNEVRLKQVSEKAFQSVTKEDIKVYISRSLHNEESVLTAGSKSLERQAWHYIYVIGGYIQSRTGPMCPRTQSLERYNLHSKKWESTVSKSEKLQETPFLATQLFSFVIENRIMCCLYRSEKNKDSTEIWEYNPVTNCWTLALESAADLNKQISTCFATGGALFCGQNYKDNCQITHSIYGMYDDQYFQARVGDDDEGCLVVLDLWIYRTPSKVKSHSKNLKHFSVIELDSLLYVIGGSNIQSETEVESVNDVAALDLSLADPQQRTWLEKSPMCECRAICCAVVLNKHIYVIGGFNQFRLKTMERYDPSTDQWTKLAEMEKYRTHFIAVPMKEGIFVCGGKSYAFLNGGARKVLTTSEMYNIDDGRWMVTDSMKTARCMFTGVLL